MASLGKVAKLLIKNLQLLCCLLQENSDYLVNVARNGVEALDIVKNLEVEQKSPFAFIVKGKSKSS